MTRETVLAGEGQTNTQEDITPIGEDQTPTNMTVHMKNMKIAITKAVFIILKVEEDSTVTTETTITINKI